MTAAETRGLGDRRGGGWLRRASLTALAVYLAPAALVVLLIGGLGLICCTALRLAGGDPGRPGDVRSRRHGPSRAIGAPHIRTTSRSRSPMR